ncbi:MAG: hypothetical protein MI757_21890 [Pirellulales bacterium]|nr:hypothetical protein [Pirellulales bacterium]
MRSVSRFESNLIQVLRCLLGHAPLQPTLPLIVRVADRPRCLGRDCVEIVQQSLANGVMLVLAQADGWRHERFLRNGEVAEGRLWQRTKPGELGLEFSHHTMDFLMWITERNPLTHVWKPKTISPLATGDQFLLFCAFQALRDTQIEARWREQRIFGDNGLCALTFPEAFAALESVPKPDFDPWFSNPGSTVLEAMQSTLACRWVEVERSKSRIVEIDQMRNLGRTQEAILGAFLDAAERHNRRDLARFLLVASQELLRQSPTATDWTRHMNVRGLRMSQRMYAYRSAFSFLRQFERLRRWQEAALPVGYFDDGYAASQLWKADWERYEGESHSRTAAAIARSMEPLAESGQTQDSNQ